MKNTTTAKSKKAIPLKNQQRISSFFTKLNIIKSGDVIQKKKIDPGPTTSLETNNLRKQSSSSEDNSLEINCNALSIKISPKKQKNVARNTKSSIKNKSSSSLKNKSPSSLKNKSPSSLKNKSPSSLKNKSPSFTENKSPSCVKNKSPSYTENKSASNKNNHASKIVQSVVSETTENNDIEFFELKKDKKLLSNKTIKKQNKENNQTKIETENKTQTKNSSPPLVENLINKIDTNKNLFPQEDENIFAITPEKTLLKKDEDEDEEEEEKINIPYYSSPCDINNKKRKLEIIDSPDVIPSTPIENLYSKLKSKKSKKNIFNQENTLQINVSKLEIRLSPQKLKMESEIKTEIFRSLNFDDIEIKQNSITSLNDEPKIAVILKSPKKNRNSTEKTNDEFADFVFDEDEWDIEINPIEDNLNLECWHYCRVLEINKDLQQNLIIRVQSLENKNETTCILEGTWQYSRLQKDDKVNILACKSTGGVPYVINNNKGFLIYEPDLLISPTSVVGAQFCKRRGILAEKFRGFDAENKIMIVGTLVHKLLENVLKNGIFTSSLIEAQLDKLLDSKDMIFTAYSSQISLEEIKKELLPFVPKIVNFIEKYIKKPKTSNLNKDKNNDWCGTIDAIQDIEENIWCPQLGIKGKVDITVKNNNGLQNILPLELKTGRATMSLEHRGQVIMYIMMMNELGYSVSSGLLLYLREEVLKEVTTSHQEKRDLIMLRNEFAYFLKQKPKVSTENNENISKTTEAENDPLRQLTIPELPEPINHHNACRKCPYSQICTAFLSRDPVTKISDNNPLKSLSKEISQHLKPEHVDYFLHWNSLINLENNYQPPYKDLKDIWRLPPQERELRGKSISFLNITGNITKENETYIHRFTRTTKQNLLKLLTENGIKNDFIISGINSGNYVVISTDIRHAIATGFVQTVTENEISVSLERDLLERYRNKTFHIDTYESQQISSFNTTSLAYFIESTEKANRLRQLIVDKEPPVIPGKCPVEVSNLLFKTSGVHIMKKLNKIQQRAAIKSLITQDYLLIKGMPGTGKTATIVSIVQLLVLLKKTVLITSHTHSAVDNVCLRLLDCGIKILRLGSENRVHSNLKAQSETALTAHCKTVEELQQVYNSANVVAVTCLAANHPLLSQRQLDVCIVDESTQVLQCSVLKALLSTKTFILIGDPDQLPPVVRNPEAIRRGMNKSLFERLDNPESTITLTLQYRMNKVITNLANAVTYKNQLQCANENIQSAVLNIPKYEDLKLIYKEDQWILSILDPNLENSAVAVDTGPTWNIETNKKFNNLLTDLQIPSQNIKEDEERKCCNYYEVAIILKLIQFLKMGGLSSESIGIIAPYRAQVELLKKKLSNFNFNDDKSVEVNTVDQYQGRDKQIIIYSCTKSRDTTKIKRASGFEVLEDKRRLTVAITRAKHKLVIIGDFQTLKDYSPFVKLLNSLKNDHKIILRDPIYGFKWEKMSEFINE